MGRIAEALKRAEQERIATGCSPGQSVGRPAAPTRTGGAATPSQMSSLLHAELPLDAPLTLAKGLSESLVPYYERSSAITEQYRSFRTRLLSQNPHYEHRTLAITSAVPKEGKSVTAMNLAISLAEIRHLKVLVVDCDFRRGSLARMLNQPESPGLAEVLRGEITYSEAIRHTPIPNLFLIPAGNTSQRAATSLLASAAANPVFQRMQNDYHYTIIDTPPATTVSDIGIIGQMCNGVVIVIRLNRTDETAAKRTVRLLQVNNIPIMGCLLVGKDVVGSRFGTGFSSSYYRYYNYYRREEKTE